MKKMLWLVVLSMVSSCQYQDKEEDFYKIIGVTIDYFSNPMEIPPPPLPKEAKIVNNEIVWSTKKDSIRFYEVYDSIKYKYKEGIPYKRNTIAIIKELEELGEETIGCFDSTADVEVYDIPAIRDLSRISLKRKDALVYYDATKKEKLKSGEVFCRIGFSKVKIRGAAAELKVVFSYSGRESTEDIICLSKKNDSWELVKAP